MDKKDLRFLMEAYDGIALDSNPEDVSISVDAPTETPEIDIQQTTPPQTTDFADINNIGLENQGDIIDNLESLRSHAYEILSVIENGASIEPWMGEKISIAKTYMVNVSKALLYRK
jgi:hypothetical protein